MNKKWNVPVPSADLSTHVTCYCSHGRCFNQSVLLEGRGYRSDCQVRVLHHSWHQSSIPTSVVILKDIFVLIYDAFLIFPDNADMKDSNNRWIMWSWQSCLTCVKTLMGKKSNLAGWNSCNACGMFLIKRTWTIFFPDFWMTVDTHDIPSTSLSQSAAGFCILIGQKIWQ